VPREFKERKRYLWERLVEKAWEKLKCKWIPEKDLIENFCVLCMHFPWMTNAIKNNHGFSLGEKME
jgi:hypothetical protein